MIAILIAAVFAGLIYVVLLAITGSALVALIAALLALFAGIPTGGYGIASRWGPKQ
jgi:hypothetical protein